MSTIIVGLVFLLKYSSIPKLHWDRLFFNLIIKKSFPYALLVFLMSIYYYSDVIMVEQITNNIEAVNYAHGYRFFLAFNMLGYLFAGLLLPIFSKLIKDKDNVVPVSWLSFKLIFLLSVIIGVSIWIYKSDILSWRYGIVNYELDHSSETF
jgi:Na+-driven multidrug efflux pump